MKTVKVVTLSGTFPELPAARANVEARGEGSNLKSAAATAMRNLMKHPSLRSRRVTAAKLVMSAGFRVVEDGDAKT